MQEALWIISEAEKLADLLPENAPLPDRIVLSGEGRAVLLSKVFLPRLGRRAWRIKTCKTECDLLKQLRGFNAA